MNIYKVEYTTAPDWKRDYCDGFICVAESEDDARKMHPDSITVYGGGKWLYIDTDIVAPPNKEWIAAENIGDLDVQFLGVADSSLKEGIIFISFIAG